MPSHTVKERKKLKECPPGMKMDPKTGKCVPMKSGHKKGSFPKKKK